MNAINPVKIMQIYSKYAHDNRGQGRGNMHADKTNKMLCVWFLNFSFKQAVKELLQSIPFLACAYLQLYKKSCLPVQPNLTASLPLVSSFLNSHMIAHLWIQSTSSISTDFREISLQNQVPTSKGRNHIMYWTALSSGFIIIFFLDTN